MIPLYFRVFVRTSLALSVAVALTANVAASLSAVEKDTVSATVKQTLAAPTKTSPDVSAELWKLVEQLGDTEFSKRERATEHLLERGLAAKPALLDGMKHPDLEIRMRSHQILARAMQGDFERRMAAFIADVDDTQEHDLPGWQRFRDSVGGDPKSRKLFVEMLKHEAGLLETFETHPEQLGEVLSQRVRHLQSQSFNNFRAANNIHPASIATILFLGSEKSAESNSVLKSVMYSLLNHSTVKQVVRSGSHARQLMALLESWITHTEDASQPYYGLMLALNYDLKDTGLRLGRRYLKQKNVSSMVLQYGAISVGRFGSEADVDALESHLTNKTVCHTWSNPRLKKELIRIQIRDIVLAMLVQITNQNHKQYGFDLLEENPVYLFHLHTFAFLEDAQRDAALAKWKQWREKQAGPGEVPPAKPPARELPAEKRSK